jgi:hypothetical protein
MQRNAADKRFSTACYFFMRGRQLIAVHGIRNKAMKIPTKDFNLAMERMRDWLARDPR